MGSRLGPEFESRRDGTVSRATSKIAEATEEPVEAIRIFGFAAYGEYKTNLFWSLWQHRKDVAAAAVDAIGDTIRIAALLAARQFRAQHEDRVMASSDEVNAAFNMAITLATDGTDSKISSADVERKRLISLEEFDRALQVTVSGPFPPAFFME